MEEKTAIAQHQRRPLSDSAVAGKTDMQDCGRRALFDATPRLGANYRELGVLSDSMPILGCFRGKGKQRVEGWLSMTNNLVY